MFAADEAAESGVGLVERESVEIDSSIDAEFAAHVVGRSQKQMAMSFFKTTKREGQTLKAFASKYENNFQAIQRAAVPAK